MKSNLRSLPMTRSLARRERNAKVARAGPTWLLLLSTCAHSSAATPADLSTPARLATASAPFPATPDSPFRNEKPAALANAPAFVPPVPRVLKLENGATLLVVENHAVPLVAVEIVIQTGVDAEPLDRSGLSGFVAAMLLEGTKTRSSTDLEVARERLAAQLSAASGYETTTLHLNALRETLPEALALMADVLQNPAFHDGDIERLRGLALTGLSQKKGNPGALARDDFAKLLWGAQNPWGQPVGGTEATLSAIMAKDLRRFYKTWFVPNNAVVSVSGDVTAGEVKVLLDDKLSGWKAHPLPRRAKVSYPDSPGRQVVFTDLPTASQSQVWVGFRGPRAADPDVLPLSIANNVLGGLFTSRLNKNLREDKAYSYGVRSRLTLLRDVGAITAAGGVIAQHTAEALVEYEKELSRLRSGDLTDEEVVRAKEAIIRGLPSQLETNDAVAAAMAGLVELALPLDYYATLPARVAAVQKSEVAAVIQKDITPVSWPVVVVGPKALAEDPIRQLGFGEIIEQPAR